MFIPVQAHPCINCVPVFVYIQFNSIIHIIYHIHSHKQLNFSFNLYTGRPISVAFVIFGKRIVARLLRFSAFFFSFSLLLFNFFLFLFLSLSWCFSVSVSCLTNFLNCPFHSVESFAKCLQILCLDKSVSAVGLNSGKTLEFHLKLTI